ncbi:MAG: hypothetical protein D6748_09115 [Calditrichaeota bacterium]|nr:MAG: hypothetical protein D6748_09115 [Calditrichota bacterium]
MNKRSLYLTISTIALIWFLFPLHAQFYRDLRGDPNERRKNVHSGNQVRTTFFNYGLIGRINQAEDFGGEWPINTGHFYVGDISVMVGAEVELPSGAIIRPVTVSDGPRGNNEYNPNDPNDFWGWEPLPGFANPDTNVVAMSHQPNSWPPFWPDREGDALDPGWPGQWNGFFGKDQFNADQESYWWMDDSRDREFILRQEPFYPDSTDAGDPSLGGSRGGLALVSSVRGLQWSQTLAQNTIFWLYEVTNVGTTNYDKSVFGMIVGTIIGGDGDTNDDNSKFDADEDLTYSWDYDNIGNTGWSPVGYLGYAFLESPGNRLNGFDDDGDGSNGPGAEIDIPLLQPSIAQVGDPIVLIDYNSPIFARTVTQFPDSGVTIHYNNKSFHIDPGDSLVERPFNNIDDNLNGLIDENTEIPDDGIDNNGNGLIDEPNPQIGLKYIDYLNNVGTNNTMIDEGRDDGIDNDGDWNPDFDDVGLDGKPNTGDPGEGDGVPTSGFIVDPVTGERFDTGLPGEPNIDKTDVDESDQIGLTSFYFFAPFNVIKLRDDFGLWQALRPGFFNETLQNVDGDFIYGTGYFPLRAKQTERISLAFFFGNNKDEIFKTKRIVQVIYNNDYSFAKAPVLPIVKAVPGDNRVTLYWDSKSEDSFDRLSLEATGNGFDFEGYKIYRATFPTFDETGTVTNVFGARVADVPIAQFDVVDADSGFFPAIDEQLGSVFYLGDNTGLVHTFTDTTVKNGFTYFYAVTAYDRGVYNPAEDQILFPAETSKFAAITQGGQIELGQNVVMVRPEAPVAGYVGPRIASFEHVQGDATGQVIAEPIDPLNIRDGNTYEVTFSDTIYPPGPEHLNDPMRTTTSFSVRNLTTGELLVDANENLDVDATVFEGIKLHIMNDMIQPLLSEAKWVDSTRNILEPSGWSKFSAGLAQGRLYPASYQLEVYDDAQGDSSAGIPIFGLPNIPAFPTNIKVKNVSEGHYVKFNLYDRSPGTDGILDQRDQVVIFELDTVHTNAYQITYLLQMDDNDNKEIPQPGDVLILPVRKSFLSYDRFVFQTSAPSVDEQKAKNELDRIKVVPNPYIATATWEPKNTFRSGRGQRSIHFIHLPQRCTIRIYNVRGELVDTIEHDSPVTNGTADWDLLSKDNLEVSYGVYIYHIEAPGIGQTTGKFAVIK